jgi:hypothetical protein
MGKERVEAQTDGGLLIDVPDPLAQTKLGKSVVWTRSYYVLPLEVLFPLFTCWPVFSRGTHRRQNARFAAERQKMVISKNLRLLIPKVPFLLRKCLPKCSE